MYPECTLFDCTLYFQFLKCFLYVMYINIHSCVDVSALKSFYIKVIQSEIKKCASKDDV